MMNEIFKKWFKANHVGTAADSSWRGTIKSSKEERKTLHGTLRKYCYFKLAMLILWCVWLRGTQFMAEHWYFCITENRKVERNNFLNNAPWRPSLSLPSCYMDPGTFWNCQLFVTDRPRGCDRMKTNHILTEFYWVLDWDWASSWE